MMPLPAGAWTTVIIPIATVDASGLVTGVAAGTATISYTVTNGNGCTNIVNAS